MSKLSVVNALNRIRTGPSDPQITVPSGSEADSDPTDIGSQSRSRLHRTDTIAHKAGLLSQLAADAIRSLTWKSPKHVSAITARGQVLQRKQGHGNIQPRVGKRFPGPLVILTSLVTCSAAEEIVIPFDYSIEPCRSVKPPQEVLAILIVCNSPVAETSEPLHSAHFIPMQENGWVRTFNLTLKCIGRSLVLSKFNRTNR